VSGSGAIIIWLCVVIASATIVVYLARRWGHDPFGWVILTAAMGPISLVALVGTHLSDRARSKEKRDYRSGAPRPILVAVDGSQAATDAIIHHAADALHGDAAVVLHVSPYESQLEGHTTDQSMQSARDATEQVTLALRRACIPVNLEVRYGVPGEAIVRRANEVNAQLILVGRRGSGLARTLLGSTSQYVAEHAARPVAVVG
jgi:nucleotide-binding universal stress UspA family protein